MSFVTFILLLLTVGIFFVDIGKKNTTKTLLWVDRRPLMFTIALVLFVATVVSKILLG